MVIFLNRKLIDSEAADPWLVVWCRFIVWQYGLHEAEELLLSNIDLALFILLGLNDLIDSWTYYELVGLHGLYLCNLIEFDDIFAQSVRSAMTYYLGHI